MGVSINELLDYLTLMQLKPIATSFLIGKKVTRKLDLMRLIEDYLINNLENVLKKLTENEKLFIAELVYNGSCDPITFSAKYKTKSPLPQVLGCRGNLVYFHLFVTDLLGNIPLSVPDELITSLRSLLPKPCENKIETVQEIPSVHKIAGLALNGETDERIIHVYKGECTVFQEARRILSLVQAGKINVTAKNKVTTSATMKKIPDAMALPDHNLEIPEGKWRYRPDECGPVKAYAWPIILQQMGWCKSQNGKLVLTKSGKDFIKSPDVKFYRKDIIKLLMDNSFDEMNRVNNIHGQKGKARDYMSPPSYRKELICAALSRLPINDWISIDEMLRYIYATNNGFYVIDDGYYLYFTDHQYGHLSGYEHDLSIIYFRAFLFETLATLGLVDIAYVYPHYLWPDIDGCYGIEDLCFCSRYDGLLYFRLNELGAYCLGATHKYAAPVMEDIKTLKVLPNHDIIIVRHTETNSSEQHFLEHVAVQLGEYSWRLDKKPMLNFIETGGNIGEVKEFLEQRSLEDIPESVLIFFNDLEEKIDAFGEVEEAILLEVKDPLVASLIAHSSHTKKYCHLAGDRHLAIPKKRLRAFCGALKKTGYVLT